MSEIETAINAALTAGKLLRDGFSKPHKVTYKGTIDIVTEMDQKSEQLICGILKHDFPKYGIQGEEGAKVQGVGKSSWIIDPLDGTTNYSKGYPFFAISIALEKHGQTTLGVVYNPLLDEMFVAERGCGSTMNGNPIRVTQTHSLGKSLVASGFPYDAWTNNADNGAEFHRLIKRVISMRSDGSAALDLCHVAMGRLDGYWELDLEAWDMAAGALIVKEAGGMVTLTNGEPFSPYQRSIFASNTLLHSDILSVINIVE